MLDIRVVAVLWLRDDSTGLRWSWLSVAAELLVLYGSDHRVALSVRGGMGHIAVLSVVAWIFDGALFSTTNELQRVLFYRALTVVAWCSD